MTTSDTTPTTDAMTARTAGWEARTVRASAARQAMPWTLTAAERRSRLRDSIRMIKVSERLDR